MRVAGHLWTLAFLTSDAGLRRRLEPVFASDAAALNQVRMDAATLQVALKHFSPTPYLQVAQQVSSMQKRLRNHLRSQEGDTLAAAMDPLTKPLTLRDTKGAISALRQLQGALTPVVYAGVQQLVAAAEAGQTHVSVKPKKQKKKAVAKIAKVIKKVPMEPGPVIVKRKASPSKPGPVARATAWLKKLHAKDAHLLPGGGKVAAKTSSAPKSPSAVRDIAEEKMQAALQTLSELGSDGPNKSMYGPWTPEEAKHVPVAPARAEYPAPQILPGEFPEAHWDQLISAARAREAMIGEPEP